MKTQLDVDETRHRYAMVVTLEPEEIKAMGGPTVALGIMDEAARYNFQRITAKFVGAITRQTDAPPEK